MTRIGLYSGSFDPVTLGHTDVIEQAANMVDSLIIAIGVHVGKKPVFSADERIEMLQKECDPICQATGCDISVLTFDGLVVDIAKEVDAKIIFRGLRDGTDLDYEMQMVGMNTSMSPDIKTVFVPAAIETRHIAASLVRQIAAMGGDTSHFVSPDVSNRLKQRFSD